MKDPIKTLGAVFLAIGLPMAALAVAFALLFREPALRLGLSLPFGICGVTFTGLGAGFFLSAQKKRRVRDDLLSHGEAVSARIIGLEENPGVMINGRRPKRLVCQYEENGTTYVCKSWDLPGYPAILTDTVTVYRDPYNIKSYYVDAESAIEQAVEL